MVAAGVRGSGPAPVVRIVPLLRTSGAGPDPRTPAALPMVLPSSRLGGPYAPGTCKTDPLPVETWLP